MTIFAEPSVTLCGERAVNHDAVCCVDVTVHADKAHVFIAMTEVERRLSHTFTPCKWAKPV